MSTINLASWTIADYEQAADEYCVSLPLEHFMEATPQATQREITLESLALVKVHRRDLHVFNELLVQYPINAHLGQVVPDNMVVLSEEEIQATGSYNLPFEPAAPFWMLEYVSRKSKRKDYKDNFKKYEQELKVPYYLVYNPEKQDLRLYHHTGVLYEQVQPNTKGRLGIPELKLEVAVLDGWVRYWYRGKLLPLPAELQRDLNQARAQLKQAEQRVEEEMSKRTAAEAEVETLRILVEQLRQQARSSRPKKKK